MLRSDVKKWARLALIFQILVVGMADAEGYDEKGYDETN